MIRTLGAGCVLDTVGCATAGVAAGGDCQSAFLISNAASITDSGEDNLGPGLLFSLPANLYLNWARKDPARRAGIVVRWLPIAIKAEDGSLSWHPALVDFVSEFGAEPNVLSGISRRLQPSSWWGSLTPFLEPLLPLLGSWSGHQIPEVRRWVRKQIEYIRAEIRRADQDDEESIVRY